MPPSTPAEDELFEAIGAGDEPRVIDALGRGASVNAARKYKVGIDRDLYDGTLSALMHAVNSGRSGVVQLLLAKGAEPDAADAFSGNTPLLQAAACGQEDVVAALLAAGASPAARDAYAGENTLTAAIKAGHAAIARSLLRAGAPLEPRALEEACRLGREDLVEMLMESGIALRATRALVSAASAGRVAMIHFLATRGADLRAQGPEALQNAANAGLDDVVRCLLSLGVPVDSRTSYGWTPLHLAAYNGNAATVRALLEAGADPRADDGAGKTPLAWARQAGKAENVAALEAALGT
ncbi:MAG TPA: ankyrin repeat domain-containing protein [Polyangiaceae bacterium]|nr:ankyrin repeat domain-containing protein [Polyangiaceae bacterium]